MPFTVSPALYSSFCVRIPTVIGELPILNQDDDDTGSYERGTVIIASTIGFAVAILAGPSRDGS